MPEQFFSTHSRFLETSDVGSWPDRLNLRYEAIIRRNVAALQGARVLDIASHDGRWSCAALDAGAAHVTGVEVRPELSRAAGENLRAYGYGADRFTAVTGDVFSQRDLFAPRFDVVLCLGFLYHTTRHEEIIELIRSTGAKTVIVDTRLSLGRDNCLEIRQERSDHPANGLADRGVRNDTILHAWPTTGALSLMLGHFGYSIVTVDWQALIAQSGVQADIAAEHGPSNPVGDYAAGRRGTFIAAL